MPYINIREEELKNKIALDFFWQYDCTRIIGNVDFCVSMHDNKKEPHEQESLLWAEAKKGTADMYKSITQLILTIGKARTFDKYLPPAMLGAFDSGKIAFIPYNDISEIFYLNDFNWNVTPSNHETKEFKIIFDRVKAVIEKNALLFDYEKDNKELHKFIKNNFVVGRFGISKTMIDKNNFMVIYNKWLVSVKPSIAVNWEVAKKSGIIDGDFYLADLLSQENETLKDKLFVLLKKAYYELDRKIDKSGLFSSLTTSFNDGQIAHHQFWNKYQRPPKEEYWDYIVERRDLLVPQDVRERKGSFFTPQIWVELSQKYLTDVLGEDWQDEYYIWDCAAGTGNLLTGLTNKYNIWASTLDQQDVEVMKDRIKNGANLLEDHVFQFDFLNDEFTKLPQKLQDIINDPEKRKKLVIYINPPYAEARGEQEFKSNLKGVNISKQQIISDIGNAKIELFAQFLIRIYFEISGCKIAEFSKLKTLNAPNFQKFRKIFRAKLIKCFVVPADTFDNVKGQFPIGFKIWDTTKKEVFKTCKAYIYDKNGNSIGSYSYFSYDGLKFINDWIKQFNASEIESIGGLIPRTNDFQHQSFVMIVNPINLFSGSTKFYINKNNLIYAAIYFAVRHCIEASWLNDRDQFLYPNDGWQKDTEFQNDCLTFTLFHSQNRITSKEGTNHWIPFTEQEVNAREKFDSNFMSDFVKGKSKPQKKSITTFSIIFEPVEDYGRAPLKFSKEAMAVFDAGRELWRYYHKQPNCNVNASLYDIREHFQVRNDKGKMNNKSSDAEYTRLIGNLRDKLKLLAKKIEPKVYEYGFLKG